MRFRPAALAACFCLLAPAAHAKDSLPPLHVSGFIESGYALATADVEGRIVGNFYDARHNEFMLHAAMLKVERAAPAKRPGTGFLIEAMAGRHATAVRAAGLNLGEHADLIQAFGVMGFPAVRLQISVGKMATMLGNEVIESVSNPNLSFGSQFVFAENATDTGVDASWAGERGWSARARISNGWDVVADNNTKKTAYGRLGWSDATRGVALLAYTGSELPDSVRGQRTGAEILANAQLGSLTTTLQLDAGRDGALDASWRAAGIWLQFPLDPGLSLALRGDVLDDTDGFRTSGALGFPPIAGQTLLGFAHADHSYALIRPELRYDHSSRKVFDGHWEQWTVAIGAALLF